MTQKYAKGAGSGIQSGIPGMTVHASQRHLPLDEVRKWRVATTIKTNGDFIRLPNGTPKVFKWDLSGTKREALEERDRRIQEAQEAFQVSHGKATKPPRTASAAFTVQDYAERHFLPWVKRKHEPATYALNERLLRVHIYPKWGPLSLQKIQTPEVIEEITEYLCDPGQQPCKPGMRKNASRNKVLGALSNLLGHASDPTRAPQGLPLCTRPRIPLLPDDPKSHSTIKGDEGYEMGELREQRHTEEECRKLVDAAKWSAENRCPWDYAIVGLALYCGLRIGEIAGLRWKHVDFEKGRIKVCEQIDCETHEPKAKTKNKEIGFVGVEAEFLEHLRQLKAKQINTEYVVGNHRGYQNQDDLIKRYQAVAKKAWGLRKGKECKHIHRLRHTYASRLADRGLGAQDIKVALRDKSVKTAFMYIAPREDLYEHIKASAAELTGASQSLAVGRPQAAPGAPATPGGGEDLRDLVKQQAKQIEVLTSLLARQMGEAAE